MNEDILIKVRERQPLIHHLTNRVVMNMTANGLLSFGGSPIMAEAMEEIEDIVTISDGVLLNIGTLKADELPAMISAGEAANKKNIPVVLDPVGVAATPFRMEAVKEILNHVRVTAIKGNAGEMAHLVQMPWETKGVESLGQGRVEEVAAKVTEVYQTRAIVTGEVDAISTGKTIIHNHTGHAFLTKVTGAGCLLGSILTACLTTDDPFEDQAKTAVGFYGLAAEYAARHADVTGPGTFLPQFIDALSLDLQTLRSGQ